MNILSFIGLLLTILMLPTPAIADINLDCEPVASGMVLPDQIAADEIQCVAKHDLNGDGDDEQLLFYGTPYCGSSGCLMKIYQRMDNGWYVLLSAHTEVNGITFLGHETSGYQDVSVLLKVPCDQTRDCKTLGNLKPHIFAFNPEKQTYTPAGEE